MRNKLIPVLAALCASAALPAAARAQHAADAPAASRPAAPDAPTQLADFGKGKVILLLAGEQPIPSLADEIVAEAQALGRALQASGLALEDLQVAVGCADRSVACMQRIGKSVAAAGLLVVGTRKVADEVELTLRLLHIDSGADTSRATVLLPLDPPARQPLLARVMASIYQVTAAASQPAGPPTGALLITASDPGVEIRIDGQPRGALPLDLRDMPAGTYRLAVDQPGFFAWEGQATVKANRSTRVHIELVPAPRTPPQRTFLGSIRLPTWIVGGVGLVSLSVAAIFGGHMLAEQNAFDDAPAETLADLRHMESLRDSGRRDAAVANVMLGIGGAALVTAAVLAIIDYRYSREAPAAPGATPSASRRGAPRVSATIGGFGLRF